MGLFSHWKTDPESFVKQFRRSLTRAGIDGFTFEPEAFRLCRGDHFLNLHNAYHEYCHARRGDRQLVIDRFISTLAGSDEEIPGSWSEVHEHLMPVVRSPAYYESAALQARLQEATAPSFAHQILGDAVGVGLAYDRESSMAMVPEDELERWGQPFAAALEVAKSNLRRRSDAPMAELLPGLYLSAWGDSYDSSRLLLPDVLYRQQVRGDPVVLVPVRDALLLTGHKDEAGLAAMAELAAKFLEEPRWVSFQMLRYQEERWERFLPPGAVGGRLRRLQLEARLGDYAHQKKLLEAIHERDRTDVFVASLMGMEDKATGEARSFCTWTEGVDTLLPEADVVVLLHPGDGGDGSAAAGEGGAAEGGVGSTGVRGVEGDGAEGDGEGAPPPLVHVELSWVRALELFGDRMERDPALWLPRYRVRTFPDEAEWRALLAAREEAERTGSGEEKS